MSGKEKEKKERRAPRAKKTAGTAETAKGKKRKPRARRNTVEKPKKTPGVEPAAAVGEALIFPAHDVIIFPFTLTPLLVDDAALAKRVDKTMADDKLICLFPEMPIPLGRDIGHPELTQPRPVEDAESFEWRERRLSRVGTLCRIVKKLRFPDDSIRLLARGVKRIRVLAVKKEKVPNVLYEEIPEELSNDPETEALKHNIVLRFQEVINLSPIFPEEMRIAILNVDEPERLVDMIADALNLNFLDKLNILVAPDVKSRLQLLAIFLHHEIEVLKLGAKIQTEVNDTLGKTQKEIFLREQMNAIKKELGEDVRPPDIAAIDDKMAAANLPEHVEETIKKELERMTSMHHASPEYSVAHTYVEWLVSLPWNTFTEDSVDIAAAAATLDADHHALEKVKDRVLDFLAVLQLKNNRKSPVLCFVGPPGVGKTSLGKSIAKAMGRKFVRASLGGIRDEAEIRGHRRTYVGALPGRIIQGMKKAGAANPVFMLDEIDKIGNDFRGDPASALLEVLDPEQNNAFNDHYIEVDFDLSSVMFIATANITDTIPPPLLDRMEIIRIPGYTTREKKEIAKRFLLPRQLKENGLMKKQLFITMPAVESLIVDYTREAGVRKLEREIAAVCRKTARKIIEGKIEKGERTAVAPKDLPPLLGPIRYIKDEAERDPGPGLALGMAWTSVGGAILPVETTSMPGKGELKLTGSLGDVMKESAQAAFTYVKSKSSELGIDPKTFENKDFHIHIPDGATPKDGPSAGITMVVSLISHLLGKSPKPRVAMTGEITLRGKVTPVGGIKEKVIAALAAGVKKVVMPEENEKDLEDIPKEVRGQLKFTFVSEVSQAINAVM